MFGKLFWATTIAAAAVSVSGNCAFAQEEGQGNHGQVMSGPGSTIVYPLSASKNYSKGGVAPGGTGRPISSSALVAPSTITTGASALQWRGARTKINMTRYAGNPISWGASTRLPESDFNPSIIYIPHNWENRYGRTITPGWGQSEWGAGREWGQAAWTPKP